MRLGIELFRPHKQSGPMPHRSSLFSELRREDLVMRLQRPRRDVQNTVQILRAAADHASRVGHAAIEHLKKCRRRIADVDESLDGGRLGGTHSAVNPGASSRCQIDPVGTAG